ncbi:hypothetical protein KIW84_065069 [Lathyrus oleraceus]|uniref:Uncharacterized protein n=1 Tax=Pisum sativum TaxID=3888 RepID=A0A9D5A6Y8_PEA|nr:hypothetical protein KIW84_065069 [Pisum sativum]
MELEKVPFGKKSYFSREKEKGAEKWKKGKREPENKGWREEELEAAGFAELTQVELDRSRSRESHSRSGSLVSGHTRMALGNTRMRWHGTRMALGNTRMDEEDDVLNVDWSLLFLAVQLSNVMQMMYDILGIISRCFEYSTQDAVVDSTIEVEYIAALSAAKEAVWINKLDIVPSIVDPIGLYYDNNGVIAQAKEPRSH